MLSCMERVRTGSPRPWRRAWSAALCLAVLLAPPTHAREVCLSAPYAAAEGTGTVETEIAALVASLAPVLERFPSIAGVLERSRPDICFEERLGTAHGYFEPDAMKIVLRKDLPPGLARGILLHELRHLDQFARGACVPDGLTMQEHARGISAMEADASAISLLMAWDMREAGDPAIWEALAAWPSQADLAAGMAEVFADGGTPAEAVSRTFALWYAREDRVLRYYRSSCSAWLDEQDRSHALDTGGTLDTAYLRRLCALPDGSSYPCEEPDGPR